MANTLAYYDTATITAVKSFIVQAPAKVCPYDLFLSMQFLLACCVIVLIEQHILDTNAEKQLS